MAVEALNHLDEVEKLKEIYADRNEYTVNKMKDNRKIEVIKANGGFYLVIMCEDFMKRKKFKTSLDLARDILFKTGVAVVPGSDFGVPKGFAYFFYEPLL